MPETGETKPCVFCEIIAGRAPAYVVEENETALCILDINPFTEGHCLVIPKRHIQWWHEMTENETAGLFTLARKVANRLMEVYEPDFVCEYARGRRIPHTHVFLVPAFAGDPLDRYFYALEGFQESPRALASFADPNRLRAAADKLKVPT